MGRVTERPNPNEHLLERILSYENVHRAWKRGKSNKGAPGVDGITIEDFQEHPRPLWFEIREWLLVSKNCGWTFTIRPRPDKLREPPGADPLDRWCGGWGRKTPGYPIIFQICILLYDVRARLRALSICHRRSHR